VSTTDPRASEVRSELHDALERKGHAVDNARAAMAVVESALAEGVFERTPDIDQTLADLRLALEQDDGQKLGGKSAEAARFITRRLQLLINDAQ
jgi:hypothetical protein